MNIYVANFDTAWNDDNLKELFLPYGEVKATQIMMDGFTERSRGFGYVDMPNESAAETAISALHGKESNGQKLIVKLGNPPEERKGSYKVSNTGVNPYRFKKN